jgi:hypothetical protein
MPCRNYIDKAQRILEKCRVNKSSRSCIEICPRRTFSLIIFIERYTNYRAMDQHQPRFLVLDRPCSYCRLLEFDDLVENGVVRHDLNENSDANLVVHKKERWGADSGTDPWERVKLEYERHDMLPSLPGLAETASQGCVFCKVLRDDLISATAPDGQDTYTQETNTKILIITCFIFTLHYTKISHGGNAKTERRSHDHLDVYFTIDSGDKQMKHSLRYIIYMGPSGMKYPVFSTCNLN